MRRLAWSIALLRADVHNNELVDVFGPDLDRLRRIRRDIRVMVGEMRMSGSEDDRAVRRNIQISIEVLAGQLTDLEKRIELERGTHEKPDVIVSLRRLWR